MNQKTRRECLILIGLPILGAATSYADIKADTGIQATAIAKTFQALGNHKGYPDDMLIDEYKRAVRNHPIKMVSISAVAGAIASCLVAKKIFLGGPR